MENNNQLDVNTPTKNFEQSNNLLKSEQGNNPENINDSLATIPKKQINPMQRTVLSSSGQNNMNEILETPRSNFEPLQKSELKKSQTVNKGSRNMFRNSNLSKKRDSIGKVTHEVRISGNSLLRKSQEDNRSKALSESFDYGKLSRNSLSGIQNNIDNKKNDLNLLESNIKNNEKQDNSETFSSLQLKTNSKKQLDVLDINTKTSQIDCKKNLFCSQEKLITEEMEKEASDEEDLINVQDILDDIMDNQSEDSLLVLNKKEFLVESTIEGVGILDGIPEVTSNKMNDIQELEQSQELSKKDMKTSSVVENEKNQNSDQNSVSKWAIANSALTPIEIPDIKEFLGDFQKSDEKSKKDIIDFPHEKDGHCMNLSMNKKGTSNSMSHSNDLIKNSKVTATQDKKMLETLKAENISLESSNLKITQNQKEESIASVKNEKPKLNFNGIDPGTLSYLIWETETEKNNMEIKVKMLNQKLEIMKNSLQDSDTKDFSNLENNNIKLTPKKTDISEVITTPRGIIKNSNKKYSGDQSLENTISKFSQYKSSNNVQNETRMSTHISKINLGLNAKSKQLREKKIQEDILIEKQKIPCDIKKDFMRNPTIPEMKESGQSFYKPNKVNFDFPEKNNSDTNNRKNSPDCKNINDTLKIDEEGSQFNKSEKHHDGNYEKLMRSSHFPFQNVLNSIHNSCKVSDNKSNQNNDNSQDSHELREELENSFVVEDKSGDLNNAVLNNKLVNMDVQSTLIKSSEEILDEKTVANLEGMIDKQNAINFQESSYMVDSRVNPDQKLILTRNLSMMQPNANNHYEDLNSNVKNTSRSPQKFGKGIFQNSQAQSSIKHFESLKNKNILRKQATIGVYEQRNNLSNDLNTSPNYKSSLIKNNMIQSQKLKNYSRFNSRYYPENYMTNREENMINSIQEFHETRNKIMGLSAQVNKDTGIDQNTSIAALGLTKTQIINNNLSSVMNFNSETKNRENVYAHYVNHITSAENSKIEENGPLLLTSYNAQKTFLGNQTFSTEKKVPNQDSIYGKDNENPGNQGYMVKSIGNLKNNKENYKKFQVQSSADNFVKNTSQEEKSYESGTASHKNLNSNGKFKDEIYKNTDIKDKKVDFQEFLSCQPKNQFSDSAKNSLNMNDYNILIDPNASIDKIIYDKALLSKYFNEEQNSSFNKLSMIINQNSPNVNHGEMKTNFDKILKDLNFDESTRNHEKNHNSLKIVRNSKEVVSNVNSPKSSMKGSSNINSSKYNENFKQKSTALGKELDEACDKQLKNKQYLNTTPTNNSIVDEQKRTKLAKNFPNNQSQNNTNKKSPSNSPVVSSNKNEISRIYGKTRIKSSKKAHVKKGRIVKNELYVSRSIKGDNALLNSNPNIEKLATIKSLKPPIHAKANKYNRKLDNKNLNETNSKISVISKLKSQRSRGMKRNMNNANLTQDIANSQGCNEIEEDSIIEMKKDIDNGENETLYGLNSYSNSNFYNYSPKSSFVNNYNRSNSPRGVYIFSDAKKRVDEIRNLKNIKNKMLIADRIGGCGNFDVVGQSINDQNKGDKRSISESYKNYILENSDISKNLTRKRNQKIGLGNSSQSKTYSQTVECKNSSLLYNSSNVGNNAYKHPNSRVMISTHQELYENVKSKLSSKFESLKIDINNNIKESRLNKMQIKNLETVTIDKKNCQLAMAKNRNSAKREMLRKNKYSGEMNDILINNINRRNSNELKAQVSPNTSRKMLPNAKNDNPRSKTYGPVKNSILKNANEYQTLNTKSKSIEKVN